MIAQVRVKQPQRAGIQAMVIIIPRTTKLLRGILVSLRPSVRPSVRLSRIPCPLYRAYSSGWFHFIFIHLSKQLQVCHV